VVKIFHAGEIRKIYGSEKGGGFEILIFCVGVSLLTETAKNEIFKKQEP